MIGTITKLKIEKGYGFIACEGEDGDGEFFFHRSQMPIPSQYHDLREGDTVTFEIEQCDKGPRATQVQPTAAPVARFALVDNSAATW